MMFGRGFYGGYINLQSVLDTALCNAESSIELTTLKLGLQEYLIQCLPYANDVNKPQQIIHICFGAVPLWLDFGLRSLVLYPR